MRLRMKLPVKLLLKLPMRPLAKLPKSRVRLRPVPAKPLTALKKMPVKPMLPVQNPRRPAVKRPMALPPAAKPRRKAANLLPANPVCRCAGFRQSDVSKKCPLPGFGQAEGVFRYMAFYRFSFP